MDNDKLLSYAVLGKQLEQFWASDVGKYLHSRALKEYTAAVDELMTCDPTNTHVVMRAQGRAWQAEHFEKWVNEGIEAGLRAHQLLEEGSDDSVS